MRQMHRSATANDSITAVGRVPPQTVDAVKKSISGYMLARELGATCVVRAVGFRREFVIETTTQLPTL
jgi:hypothetical protein